jgi:hypothetical protein
MGCSPHGRTGTQPVRRGWVWVRSCRYWFYPISFPVGRRKLSPLFERQPNIFMPENYPVKLLIPQIRPAADHERLKFIVTLILFGLLAAGTVAVTIIRWGAKD